VTFSASTPTLAVTGATGRLGRRVAERLSAAGVPQRLVVRDPDRAPSLAGAEAVRAEYADGAAARRALEGVTTLFMVSGAEEPGRVETHRTFIDAAVAAGVTHLVYTSFFGAAPDATFTLARDHWATEQHITASGLHATILRDNLYIDFFPLMVGDDGVLRGPAGEGRVAAVTQDDIADAAVAVLREPDQHVNARYDLTGPAALTLREVAATIAEVTGRPVSYQDESLNEAYASRAVYGAPAWQVEAWVSTYTAIAAGELDGVTGAIPALTGHPATSLADFLSASSTS
jgi:uncharacterized protein YbjT (DUF2867 family)